MKETLKLIGASLFRNDAAIAGRKKPWYLALIIFILSIIMAVVPITVSVSKTSGDDFFNSTLYSYEIGVQKFAEALDAADVNFTVQLTTDNEKIMVESGDWSTLEASGKEYFEYVSPTTSQTVLRVYARTTEAESDTAAFVDTLLALTNSTDAPNTDITSFAVIGSKLFYAFAYNPANVAAGSAAGSDYTASFRGNYTDVETGTNLRNFTKYDVTGDQIVTPTAETYATYQAKVLANWEQFFKNAYAEVKQTLLWSTTGIMLGVNAIVSIFMMLMVFLITRGKNNPNRDFTILDSVKVGAWSTLSPALITLIVGFIFVSYASMIFVMTMGLRIMWMSMKNLRPMPPAQPTVRR